MYKFIITLTLILVTLINVHAQHIQVKDFPIDKDKDLFVAPLYSDNTTSSFVISVKKGVPLHKHNEHTEQVLVIEGKGLMTLGDKTFKIRKGDIIIIPMGEAHSVKVTSKKPLLVVSIQAPEFKGDDRIWL